MSESRIVVETDCDHGKVGGCSITIRCGEDGAHLTHPCNGEAVTVCPGGSRRIIDPESLPAEVIEAAAINRAHFDGIDYGEPYDQWPESFEEDGEPWGAEEAKEFYRDQARSALSAAFRKLGNE